MKWSSKRMHSFHRPMLLVLEPWILVIKYKEVDEEMTLLRDVQSSNPTRGESNGPFVSEPMINWSG